MYPHVRGGSTCSTAVQKTSSDVSPRAWGKLLNRSPGQCANRCIPTCVGEALEKNVSAPQRSMYPHLRGGSYRPRLMYPLNSDVSPRAWGKCGQVGSSFCPCRCIPTCVGEAKPRQHRVIKCMMYPHVRGGSRAKSWDTIDRFDVSPRAWGKCVAEYRPNPHRRCIPTCVGEALFNKYNRLNSIC